MTPVSVVFVWVYSDDGVTPGRDKHDGIAEQGYLHCGANSAGHFVKMVHNGIEYGIMAGYAEGLAVLRGARIGRREAVEPLKQVCRCPDRIV